MCGISLLGHVTIRVKGEEDGDGDGEDWGREGKRVPFFAMMNQVSSLGVSEKECRNGGVDGGQVAQMGGFDAKTAKIHQVYNARCI